MRVFRITSSTSSIFNFSRILWTNFEIFTEVDHVSGFGPSWHRFEICSRILWINLKKLTDVDQKINVFRITSSTTSILNVNRILWTNFKILRLIRCQGSDYLGTDLKYIVGFCEQTSKSWPRWIKKTNVFRITSSTTSIFNFSRILWTNFKKLTEVD